MDIINQIVAALAAGAVVAAKDLGGGAVKDAYAGLRSGILYLFGSEADAAANKVHDNPESREARKALRDALTTVSAGDIDRLEKKIGELKQAIAADPKAKATIEGLGAEVSIFFKGIDTLSAGDVNVHARGPRSNTTIAVENVKEVKLGNVNATSGDRSGN
jgi:hypothetical protein